MTRGILGLAALNGVYRAETCSNSHFGRPINLEMEHCLYHICHIRPQH